MDSDLLAAGSLNGILSGKHYNRCKRIHVILAAAFHKLHLQSFLEVNSTLPEASPEKMVEVESCGDVIAVLEICFRLEMENMAQQQYIE